MGNGILEPPWYPDYEEESDMWGVFHMDTGFCRSIHYTEKEAQEAAGEYNENYLRYRRKK